MTTPTGEDLTPAGIEAKIRRMCPLYEHIGLRVESVSGTVACSVPLTPANANHLGGMHAAVQWALAEAVGGVAYFAHPELGPCWIAVRDVSIQFAAVARTDLRAQARFGRADIDAIAAQLDANGTADYTLDIPVNDAAGRVVTTATGHYYLRRTANNQQPKGQHKPGSRKARHT
jgi:acyl-coenzyme A thioesterase PaaI-like protein